MIETSTTVIYVKDLQGRYILINRWYETLFNVDRREILGKTDADIFPREQAAALRQNDLKVVEAGEPIRFEEVVSHDDFTDRGPFDVILELVGASNMAGNLAALNRSGRIVVIGVAGGGANTEVDLLTLMGKRALITGSTLRARPLEEKALVTRRAEAHAVPPLASGAVRVLVEATYPLADAAAAYERFNQGGKLGKIVLVMP